MDARFTKLPNNSCKEKDQAEQTATFSENLVKLSTVKLPPL